MKNEKLTFTNFKLKKKNTINKVKIKELFIKKKDIYLLKLLNKKQNKLEFSVDKSNKESLYIKNVLYSSPKFHITNPELPKTGKKFTKSKSKINTVYLTTTYETENNKNYKDNNNIEKNFENYINKTSHRKILQDKSTSITNINDNDNENDNLKLPKEKNNKIYTQKKTKYNYERIPLKNNTQKIKNNFSYDKYFIEYIEGNSKFFNPDKPTKKIKYPNIKFNSFNTIKNNTNFNYIRSKTNFKENNSLVVIPCNKMNHINIFNELIFNEFESKKQNSNTTQDTCYKTNIFDNNYLNICRKKFNKNKNIRLNNNLNTLVNELTLGPFYKKSRQRQNKIRLGKKNHINMSLQGVPNIVKRFYGFDT